MDKKKIEVHRKLLLAKRHELAGEVDNLRHEGLAVSGDGPMDTGDEACQTYAKQVSLNISETERETLRQIDEALDRLDEGDYGLCGECGDKISDARLKALPWADLCVDCKAEKERKGR